MPIRAVAGDRPSNILIWSTSDFSNKGKRINHTKQLVNDFSGLTTRLESIDDSIAKMSRYMAAMRADSRAASSSPSTSTSGTSRSTSNETDSDDLDLFYSHLNLDDADRKMTVLNNNLQSEYTGTHHTEDTRRSLHSSSIHFDLQY